MAAKRKPWSFEETKDLIELYKIYENLWNPRNANFKNREKRWDSLRKIADKFKTSVQEIARKIKNINSQYYRERKNHTQMQKSGSGRPFRSKWFAYSALSFLQKKNTNKTRKRKSSCSESEKEGTDSSYSSTDIQQTETNKEKSNDDFKVEEGITISKCQIQETTVNHGTKSINNEPATTEIEEACQKNIKENSSPGFLISNTKTPPNDTSNKISEETLSMMRTVLQRSKNRDEYQVYGEYIAHKLRNLKTEYSKATVQHFINNILYDAQIGKYDYPSQTQVPVVVASEPQCFDQD